MSYTFQWGQVTGYIPYLAGGAMIALQLALFGFAIGMVVGAVCAAIKAYGPRLGRAVVNAYVSFFTNTPLLVQIFFLIIVGICPEVVRMAILLFMWMGWFQSARTKLLAFQVLFAWEWIARVVFVCIAIFGIPPHLMESSNSVLSQLAIA